ncbi:MAG: hypothetical protein GAK45_00345 [Pseudomonas citronellolis]|nr:MAG: hypothetical protein GAK45_00345 [Pseudomonas citronellolis]
MRAILLLALLGATAPALAMQALDDASLGQVSGRDGISLAASLSVTASRVDFSSLKISGLAASLGVADFQPLTLDIEGNQLVIELATPTGANLTAFLANTPRVNLSASNINIGGTRSSASATPTGGYNLGSSNITGLSFNYLRLSTQ